MLCRVEVLIPIPSLGTCGLSELVGLRERASYDIWFASPCHINFLCQQISLKIQFRCTGGESSRAKICTRGVNIILLSIVNRTSYLSYGDSRSTPHLDIFNNTANKDVTFRVLACALLELQEAVKGTVYSVQRGREVSSVIKSLVSSRQEQQIFLPLELARRGD